jgi:hypothetical protein
MITTLYLGVLSGDRHVVQEYVAIPAAPHDHRLISYIVHHTPGRTLYLIQLDQSRAFITTRNGYLVVF